MLFVHKEHMKKAHDVKHLDDFINESGQPKSTIFLQTSKEYRIVSRILSLLGDLAVGNLRVQIMLTLRHTWLINGILFNSKIWHSTNTEQINQLVDIDKYLLRGLVGAHEKVPL